MYSPYLELKVPFCSDLSFSVSLGPSSWMPTFWASLKMYLRAGPGKISIILYPLVILVDLVEWDLAHVTNDRCVLRLIRAHLLSLYIYS